MSTKPVPNIISSLPSAQNLQLRQNFLDGLALHNAKARVLQKEKQLDQREKDLDEREMYLKQLSTTVSEDIIKLRATFQDTRSNLVRLADMVSGLEHEARLHDAREYNPNEWWREKKVAGILGRSFIRFLKLDEFGIGTKFLQEYAKEADINSHIPKPAGEIIRNELAAGTLFAPAEPALYFERSDDGTDFDIGWKENDREFVKFWQTSITEEKRSVLVVCDSDDDKDGDYIEERPKKRAKKVK